MTLTLGTGPLSAGAPATANYTIEGPQHSLLFSSFPRRIRAVFGGETILDSENAMLLHESNIFPVVYVPAGDLSMEFFTKTELSTHCPFKGDASYWTIAAGDRVAENAAWGYERPIDSAAWLKGYESIEWGRMDQWFDEDDEIFGHIRDPFHRVDARPTSRRVQVHIAGDLVADSSNTFVVSETGFGNVFYIPAADVETHKFEASATTTHCPHKGDAAYWSLAVGQVPDVAWSYSSPLEEATRVAGHWSFAGPDVEVSSEPQHSK